MKSIQTKFTVLILSCALTCCLVIGTVEIVYGGQVVDQNSVQTINLLCEHKALELDALVVHMCYNPKFTPPASGLSWSKTNPNESDSKLL